MLYKRDLEKIVQRFAKFPVVAILGPRQSGKTTLARQTFPHYRFVNLEDLELRSLVKNDPKGFLRQLDNEQGVILDEFQNIPELLSYIQVIVDEKKRPGFFVLTGSQNFLMNEAITQSLAGRIGILTLLTLSLHELKEYGLLSDVDTMMIQGGYPRIYSEQFTPFDFYPSYIHSYIERDIRQLANIGDIHLFQKFMQLCAGRIGQLLNISDLAINTGIDQRKAQEWLSILEASYVIFLLRPYFNSFNKRMVKTPKLYFYDTGIAASLLAMRSVNDLRVSPYRGYLFENMIIADIYKQYDNRGARPPVYFWRDQQDRIEIDCLIERGGRLFPIEIKSSETFNPSFFNAINSWNEIASQKADQSYLVYGGTIIHSGEKGNIINWQEAGNLIDQIEST